MKNCYFNFGMAIHIGRVAIWLSEFEEVLICTEVCCPDAKPICSGSEDFIGIGVKFIESLVIDQTQIDLNYEKARQIAETSMMLTNLLPSDAIKQAMKFHNQ